MAILTGVGLVIALVVGYMLLTGLKPKNAGILVETTPSSSVFINNEEVGRTPFETTIPPGEAVIKLVPESFVKPLAPYETKINLVSGVQTVIQRSIAESEDKSSGVILSFENTSGSETSLVVISTPDSAQVVIDGSNQGFTPFKTSKITPETHSITILAPGYEDKTIPSTKVYEGYKLTVIAKLAKKEETAIEEIPPEPTQLKVEILQTPVGYLRVRGEPSTTAAEVGRVIPGESYVVIEKDEETGWYKISFDEDKEGWVSNEYAKEVDNPTPSPDN